MAVKLFQVGGAVRDKLLGIQSKDIDFAVEASGFEEMRDFVHSTCKTVFLEKPEFLTIRALHPTMGAVDFVLCRKDGAYSDHRRPDSVEPGTIFDDLARRDFTVNAIAIDESGNIIDPHGGQEHLKQRLLYPVGFAEDRFNEDPLRILRAIRFHLTKGFGFCWEIDQILRDPDTWVPKLESISVDRIREELHKCFAHSTLNTLNFLMNYPEEWTNALFKEIKLKPTLEKL